MNQWLLLLTLTAFSGIAALPKLRRRGRHGMVGTPPTPTDTPLPPDQWFSQILDHFEPTNNQSWLQRYQVVTDYYVEGGPVFVMIGGEGDASPVWLVKGNWVNYAKQYNALMFQIEHRFYGESKPTSDLSVDNLRYLTSEQALADIAYFVLGMNAQYNLTTGTKWVAFGGSYSGNLAAWVRLKYPHLIHAAMSASGPVQATVDFYEYMNGVRRSMATYGKNCTDAVQKANHLINNLLKNPTGQYIIKKYFKLCEPINETNQNDVYNLLESLADNLAAIVQYNKDNRAFRSSTSNITIDTVCNIMVDKSLGNPVIRYAAVNSLLMDAYEESCLDFSYNNMIEELRNTDWDSVGGSYGERQWTYQTCTEFGYYQTSERRQNFFGNGFPLKFFIQQCTDIFGFTSDLVYAGVKRTNNMYGGLDLQATRVVYVQGSIDPWHALGKRYSKKANAPVIYIIGAAHCSNMYPPAPTDLPALTAARKKIGVLIGKWLQED